MSVEWVALGDGQVVVADGQRAWLHTPGPYDPFAAPMTGPGTLESTERLLEGVIAAGLRAGAARASGRRGPLTPARWVARLAAYYHLTTHTPRLLARASERWAADGRPALQAWADQKRREETGHDRLALRDLTALGLPAQAVVQALRPPTALALVARFEAFAEAPDGPLGVLGYAHAVERLALVLGADQVAAVRALFDGIDATRCLRVHSAQGSDVAHVRENVAVVCALPAPERARVALAARDTAHLCSGGAAWLPDDSELVTRLAELGAEPSALARLQPKGT